MQKLVKENKIPDASNLVNTAVLNKKISKVENKIPNHDKYITSLEFNKLKAQCFAGRLNKLI